MASDSAPRMRVEIRERVAFLTFARPSAGNAIDLQFGRELLAASSTIAADPSVRAVLMTGEGKNFCFGGDLKAMTAAGQDVKMYLSELTRNLHAGMACLAKLDAPVVAAINGTAAGAGLGLVLLA